MSGICANINDNNANMYSIVHGNNPEHKQRFSHLSMLQNQHRYLQTEQIFKWQKKIKKEYKQSFSKRRSKVSRVQLKSSSIEL
jgi:hypothetical protein